MTAATDGWFRVGKYWDRHAVFDDHYLRPEVVAVYDDQAAAQAHAAQLNTPRPAPQRQHQTALFETQEETA